MSDPKPGEFRIVSNGHWFRVQCWCKAGMWPFRRFGWREMGFAVPYGGGEWGWFPRDFETAAEAQAWIDEKRRLTDLDAKAKLPFSPVGSS